MWEKSEGGSYLIQFSETHTTQNNKLFKYSSPENGLSYFNDAWKSPFFPRTF